MTTVRESLRADHLRPGDVILHDGHAYRIKVVRLVPDDVVARAYAHVEIEASPAGQDGAGLVTQFAADRLIELAEPDDIARTPPVPQGRQWGRLLAVALVVSSTGAHRPPPAALCQQDGMQRTAWPLPCHSGLGIQTPHRHRWHT